MNEALVKELLEMRFMLIKAISNLDKDMDIIQTILINAVKKIEEILQLEDNQEVRKGAEVPVFRCYKKEKPPCQGLIQGRGERGF